MPIPNLYFNLEFDVSNYIEIVFNYEFYSGTLMLRLNFALAIEITHDALYQNQKLVCK